MPWDSDDPRARHPQVQRGMDLIGAALRRRRERRGLSQRDLERMTGVDQSTISKLENGRRCGLRWSRFARIVATLDGLDFDRTAAEDPTRPGSVPSFRSVRARQLLQDEADLLAAQIAERNAAEKAEAWDAAEEGDDETPFAGFEAPVREAW